MDKTAVVSVDIDRGLEIVGILERAKVKVRVALWTYLSEYEDWRLVVSAPKLDSPDPRDGYRVFHDALAAAGFSPEKTPPILILPTTDPFIRELRRLFAKARSVEGTRLGGQMIGDRFVEDAYLDPIS